MEFLSTEWLSELEMEDNDFMSQWHQMSPIENSVESFTCEAFEPNPSTTTLNNSSSQPQIIPQINISDNKQIFKHKKLSSSSSSPSASSNSSSSSLTTPTILCFANLESSRVNEANNNASLYVNTENIPLKALECFEDGAKKVTSRNPEQAKEHVLAERKRRERMTERFLNLSAVIPGLKKLDKATILSDAVKYIKELQERVKKLEEDQAKRPNNIEEESIVSVKRPRVSANYCDDGSYSSNDSFDSSSNHFPSPEIEVRAIEGNVLVRVYCKNRPGIIKEILSEIEKNHLIMVGSNAMPLGHNRLHVTIITQIVDDQYKRTAKRLIDNLTAIANHA